MYRPITVVWSVLVTAFRSYEKVLKWFTVKPAIPGDEEPFIF